MCSSTQSLTVIKVSKKESKLYKQVISPYINRKSTVSFFRYNFNHNHSVLKHCGLSQRLRSYESAVNATMPTICSKTIARHILIDVDFSFKKNEVQVERSVRNGSISNVTIETVIYYFQKKEVQEKN